MDDYSPRSVISVATSKLFLLAFGVNQLGSVLYAALLGTYSEQYTNLLANSFATVFTFISESFIKKEKPTRAKIVGMSLVTLGMILILQ